MATNLISNNGVYNVPAKGLKSSMEPEICCLFIAVSTKKAAKQQFSTDTFPQKD